MSERKIVVVDDEQENVDLLKEVLSDTGFDVEGFTDPAGALAAMKKSRPALALLDVQMPGMNGLQLLQAIRDTESLAGLRVILLSAIGAVTGEAYTPDDIETKYSVRPDAFVPKPIDPDRVLAAVKDLIPAG